MKVVGCFLQHENKFLLLLRHAHKPEGGTWALPGGKVEPGETDQEAIIRELEEETGYKAKSAELELIGKYSFVTSDNRPYDYVTFRVKLSHPHHVVLEDKAHAKYLWLSADECYARPDLIPDLHNLLKLVGYVE